MDNQADRLNEICCRRNFLCLLQGRGARHDQALITDAGMPEPRRTRNTGAAERVKWQGSSTPYRAHARSGTRAVAGRQPLRHALRAVSLRRARPVKSSLPAANLTGTTATTHVFVSRRLVEK
jgi:hypothetical protein